MISDAETQVNLGIPAEQNNPDPTNVVEVVVVK
jgi:hypothetical protein